MKAYHAIAPAIAVIAGGLWINHQENTLTELEEKTHLVRERIQYFDTEFASSGDGEGKARDEFTLPDGSLDWEVIAELFAAAMKGNGMPTDMKTFMRLQAKLMELDESGIEEALAKIAALDLPKEISAQVRQSLIQILAQKNPGKALDLMGDIATTGEGSLHWAQQNAFKQFATENPGGALAWLDRQVKEGKFVSKALDPTENPRLRFESALLGSLLKSDPAAVKTRLATFSEQERKQLFSDSHQWRQDGKMPAEFLELARENLDPDFATLTIANAWSNGRDDKFESVTEALKTNPFSDEERSAIVTNSVQNFVRSNSGEDNYQAAYEWAREQAPETAGSAVADALLNSRGTKSIDERFQESIQLAEKYSDPSIVSEFARQYNPESPFGGSGTIQDPALAEKMAELRNSLPTEDQ